MEDMMIFKIMASNEDELDAYTESHRCYMCGDSVEDGEVVGGMVVCDDCYESGVNLDDIDLDIA